MKSTATYGLGEASGASSVRLSNKVDDVFHEEGRADLCAVADELVCKSRGK